MILPLSIDVTPAGVIVDSAFPGEPGYAENIEYTILISPTAEGVMIDYVGEGGDFLTDEQISNVIAMANAQ